jgi:hypothetical protein
MLARLKPIYDFLQAIAGLWGWFTGGGLSAFLASAGLYVHDYPFWAGVAAMLGALLIIVPLALNLILPPPPTGIRPTIVDMFYDNRFRRISWRLGRIAVGETSERPAVIHDFMCSFKVNRGQPTLHEMYIEFPFTGKRVDMLVQCGPDYVPANAFLSIARGIWIHAIGRILLDDSKPDDGRTNHPSPEQFLKKFSEFTLVVRYDDTTFRRTYSREELKRAIDAYAESHWKPHSPRSILKQVKP